MHEAGEIMNKLQKKLLYFIVLLTEVVISVRNRSTLAEQGRGVAMVRCGGTHSGYTELRNSTL